MLRLLASILCAVAGWGASPPGNRQPSRTTTFTLVAETPAGLVTDSVLVEVGGARGVDFPQDETQFRFPLSVEREAKSKVDFVSRLN